jgi:TRAP-type C4-dicarboxylate transport system permease small subunit
MAQTATGNVSRAGRYMSLGMAAAALVIIMHVLSLLYGETISEEIWSKNLACTAAVIMAILLGIVPNRVGAAVREGTYTVLKVLLTVLMVTLVIPVSMQVLSRYTGIIPRYIWTEEIARFCFIWIIMAGAMIGCREDTHFDVDLLPSPKTVQGKGYTKLVVHGSILVVAITFVFYGYDFAKSAAYQISEISELPMWIIYMAWPVAGLVWTVFLSGKLWDDIQRIRGIEPHPEGEADVHLEVKVKLEEVL